MLSLDLQNLSSTRLGPDQGLELEREWQAYSPRLEHIRGQLWQKRSEPGTMLGWIEDILAPGLEQQIGEFRAAKAWVTDLVVLGIGGSALGAKAVDQALGHGSVRLHFVDNVEPAPILQLLTSLNPATTLIDVISKSGTTAETMAAFLVFREWLEKALADAWREHVVVTTDPAKGVLREYAQKQGLPAFDIAPSIGGRFSVLSPVGLLPLAFREISVRELLKGAEAANQQATGSLNQHLAAHTALIQYLYYTRHKPVAVLMPYSSRMAGISAWFVQLLAESLGKAESLNGSLAYVGPTPIGAVGATDQHSQVQLFREGPFDKLITLVRLKDPGPDLPIPTVAGLEDLAYLSGHSFAELLDAEARATAHALLKARRPNYTLFLDALDAFHLGMFLQQWMWHTAILGALLEINAFDQPGVELGKVYTYALMGRAGYEQIAAELNPELAP